MLKTTRLTLTAALFALMTVSALAGTLDLTHATSRLDADGFVSYATGTLGTADGASALEAADEFLATNEPMLGLAARGVELEVVSTKEGIASRHVRYQQVFNGLPVLDREVFVHMTADGRVQALQSDVAQASGFSAPIFVLDEADAVDFALAHIGVDGELRGEIEAERVLVPGHGFTPAWRVTVPALQPLGDWTVLVDARNGENLSTCNHLKCASGHGRVFGPDPVRTSGNTRLEDRQDADHADLTRELLDVTLHNLDSSGYIRGLYADAQSSKGRAHSSSRMFRYTRANDHFEEVNFYYHVDQLQAYFAELGVMNANRRRQVADVHGTSVDNSYYSPSTKKITFGDGGVDDAEDGDIILHEYGHAIHDNQVPGWGQSHESGAMGEGFGDWLATAYFSSGDYPERNDAIVGDWDAVSYSRNNPPALRRVDLNKIYPRDLQGSVHADGEIWSRALWDLRWLTGRDVSMRLVLESHFYCTPRSDFFEGAMALVAADEALYGGRYRFAIRQAFVNRGILTDADLPEDGAELTCRTGNTITYRGTLQDVLSLNGSTGSGAERLVLVDGTSPLEIGVDTASGAGKARFILYGNAGSPSVHTVSPQPYDLGTFCFPTVLVGGNPDTIWNNWGRHGRAGMPDFPSTPAPTILAHTPAEIGLGTEVTLQGFVQNPDARGRFKASVTNAVVIQVD